MKPRADRALRLLCIASAALLIAVTVEAQFGYFREGRTPPRYPPPQMPDANFTVCRIQYNSVRAEAMGMGWRTDYPYAETNFMIRLSELTRTPISQNVEGDPNTYVVQLSDPELFNCPFTVASDVGTIGLRPSEVERLRAYLLKGGFLWVDDFWGTLAWGQWAREIARVLPPTEYPILDVPADDPIFRSLYTVPQVPQITNIQFWRGVGGSTTSERDTDSIEPHFRVIRDRHERIMVVMTHNTDVADSWEREGEDPGFFYQFSPNGYALGIDVLLHAMTH
jgi:hypothetical protein